MKNSKAIEIGFAPKTVKLTDNTYLHFFYANNKGRGNNNCTIIHSSNPSRMGESRNQINDAGQMSYTYTSSWHGHVNFSKRVQSSLGV